MKYLLVILSLGVCSSFFWPSPTESPPKEALLPDSILLVKQTQMNEDEVFCQAVAGNHKVYHIRHRWMINEYSDGNIETHETRDTVWIQDLPFGQPCPGTLAELSLR